MSEPAYPSPAPSGSTRRGRRAFAVVCWAYLVAVLALWLVLQRADEWWPATILMFSPRWAFALPPLVLLPAAAFLRRRLLILISLASGLVAAWPVAGFNVPWSRLTGPARVGEPFRVLTLNMHYSREAPASLEEFITANAPDVVAIQEWPGANRSGLKAAPGWHTHQTPRLFLASRHPIRSTVELGHDSMGEHASVAHYELETPIGLVHVFSLHTATDRQGISDIIHESSKGPAEVRANSARRRGQCEYVAGQAAACRGPVVVVGDFNTPPESPIFPRVWSGYTDAFSSAGWGWGYTFVGAKTTVRIDHILAAEGWHVSGCRVGPKVGSPHRPVIAELIWAGDPPARDRQ
jgi:endonuclease/exonuclease/phosphatase (EEP) superfamily protein YafD